MRNFFKKHTVVELAVYSTLAFIFLSCNPSWAIQIKNGSTAVVSFLARNASNLSQYITGLTTGTTNITVYRKNLSALSMTTNTLSEVANGLYRITLNATHTNTTGELVYRINFTAGDYWGRDDVVDYLASDIYADTHTTGVKVIANGILSPQAFNTTGNLAGSVTGAVGSVTGNVGGNLVGNVGGNVNGSAASVVGNVGGNLVGNVGGNVNGSVASVASAVDINSNQDLTDTLSNITAVKGYVDTEVADTLSNISAVKEKTDKLTFDDSNRTIANSTALNLTLGY